MASGWPTGTAPQTAYSAAAAAAIQTQTPAQHGPTTFTASGGGDDRVERADTATEGKPTSQLDNGNSDRRKRRHRKNDNFRSPGMHQYSRQTGMNNTNNGRSATINEGITANSFDGNTSNRNQRNNNKNGHNNSRRRRRQRYHHKSHPGYSRAYSSHYALHRPILHVPNVIEQQKQELRRILERRGCTADANNENKRLQAMQTLQNVVSSWFQLLCDSRNQNAPPTVTISDAAGNHGSEDSNAVEPAIVPFGSYRLGVHRPESDLDVLLVCPSGLCSRSDFFGSFVDCLERHADCHDIHPISTAFTPVIKFKINDLPIDLLFGNVRETTKLTGYHRRKLRHQQERQKQHCVQNQHNNVLLKNIGNTIQESSTLRHADGGSATTEICDDGTDTAIAATPAQTGKPGHHHQTQQQQKRVEAAIHDFDAVQYAIDDRDLKEMDEASVRSLNGARVSQMLLEMVHNKESFRLVLRAVREWANIQGIYSNVLGFLGGINLAIMTAWICMSYPEQDSPTELLKLFFRTFAMWKWPEALTLGPIQVDPPPSVPPMPVWNPDANPRDRHHLMPIITPAYPCMNSSYNVGVPQLRRIQDEFVRTSIALDHHLNRSSSSNNNNGSLSSILFTKSNFFRQHIHFVKVTIQADGSSKFQKWFRFCESRIRLLITALETQETNAWPFTKFFTSPRSDVEAADTGLTKYESLFFVALRFAPEVETLNLRYCMSDFLHKINSWHEREAGMDLLVAHVLQDDIPQWVFDCLEGETPLRLQQRQPKTPNATKRPNTTGLTPQMERSQLDHPAPGDTDDMGSPKKRAKCESSE